MNRKRILLVVVLLVTFGTVYYFYDGHSTPKGQPPLISFSSGDLTPLKTAFNGSVSKPGSSGPPAVPSLILGQFVV